MKKIQNNPVIIVRQDHEISRKLVSPNALRVLYRLKDNGYLAYLVGGCVRGKIGTLPFFLFMY